MDTLIIVLAGFGLFFLLLILLLISALSAGGSSRRDRSESGLPSFDNELRRPARQGISFWQFLLAIVFLCFTSKSEDDRHD